MSRQRALQDEAFPVYKQSRLKMRAAVSVLLPDPLGPATNLNVGTSISV